MTRVTLIGLGEVGTVFAEDLAAAGHTDLSAWDTAFADPGSPAARAAAALPVAAAASAGTAANGAGLVVSAVTAANCHQAAAAAAPGLDPGTWFFDLNSSSPGHKQQAARAVEQAGGRYVEAALMSPIAARRLGSPFLLGGQHAAEFARAAAAWGFSDLTVYSEERRPRRREQALPFGHHQGPGVPADRVDARGASLRRGEGGARLAVEHPPAADWQAVATYFISRSLRHGRRRSEEMARGRGDRRGGGRRAPDVARVIGAPAPGGRPRRRPRRARSGDGHRPHPPQPGHRDGRPEYQGTPL